MANEVNVSDLENMLVAEAVNQAYREYRALEAQMRIAKARRDYARDRMIAYLESAGMTDFGNEALKVKMSKALAPRITDYDALLDYVHNLDEPQSEYLEERFKKGNKRQGIADPLERLVAKAVDESIAHGRSVKDCMPPGLAVFPFTRLTVTLRGGGEPQSDRAAVLGEFVASSSPLESCNFGDLDDVLGGDE